MNNYKQPFTVNDVAFAVYADDRGIDRNIIEQVLGRTKLSLQTMLSDYRIYVRTGQAQTENKRIIFPKVDKIIGYIKAGIPDGETWKQNFDDKINKFSPSKPEEMVTFEQNAKVSEPIGEKEEMIDLSKHYIKLLEWVNQSSFLQSERISIMEKLQEVLEVK